MDIIVTVGPKLKNKKMISGVIRAGANTIRLNFSHRNMDDFSNILKIVKESREKIYILQDLCGKKVRVIDGLSNLIKIYEKDEVLFCGKENYTYEKDDKKIVIPLNIQNKELIKNPIESISIKDNTMNFEIIEQNSYGIRAKAIIDPLLSISVAQLCLNK